MSVCAGVTTPPIFRSERRLHVPFSKKTAERSLMAMHYCTVWRMMVRRSNDSKKSVPNLFLYFNGQINDAGPQEQLQKLVCATTPANSIEVYNYRLPYAIEFKSLRVLQTAFVCAFILYWTPHVAQSTHWPLKNLIYPLEHSVPSVWQSSATQTIGILFCWLYATLTSALVKFAWRKQRLSLQSLFVHFFQSIPVKMTKVYGKPVTVRREQADDDQEEFLETSGDDVRAEFGFLSDDDDDDEDHDDERANHVRHVRYDDGVCIEKEELVALDENSAYTHAVVPHLLDGKNIVSMIGGTQFDVNIYLPKEHSIWFAFLQICWACVCVLIEKVFNSVAERATWTLWCCILFTILSVIPQSTVLLNFWFFRTAFLCLAVIVPRALMTCVEPNRGRKLLPGGLLRYSVNRFCYVVCLNSLLSLLVSDFEKWSVVGTIHLYRFLCLL